MTYKETLFFVAKCLTINHETHNNAIIENELKTGKVDWDSVVKLSTGHFVFPALYCNLKRANFLHYLPEELVNYMIHITDLNRERNQQIIEQAKEINQLLLANNITPIFLKGTGNLLCGLYEDIAERMVGDIDFLVSDEEYLKTIKVLENDGYSKDQTKIDTTFKNRHYPKITKEERIFAVEIHFKLVLKPHDIFFNYSAVKKNVQKTKYAISILSNKDQVLLTCFNKQINDKGNWYKTITLRNNYDIYLLSINVSTLETIKKFKHYFTPLNNFLASSSLIFNAPKSISFLENSSAKKFLNKQMFYLENSKSLSYNNFKWKLYFYFKTEFNLIINSFYRKEEREFILKRLIKKLNQILNFLKIHSSIITRTH